MSSRKSKSKKSESPSLPIETIEEIFKYITNQSTLYSCLFVNRLWCRKIVPILWARPSPLLYKERSAKSLIESYVSCFDHEERAILFADDELTSMVDDDLLHLPSPLFEYAAFLKELNYPMLRMAVRRCYRKLGNEEFSKKIKPSKPALNPNRQNTVMKALCRLFMRSATLDCVVLDSEEDIPSVAMFTRGQLAPLVNVTKLVLQITNNAPNILGLIRKLPAICTGIKNLTIEFSVDNPNEAESLATIIYAQQNLMNVELKGTSPKIVPIMEALGSQSRTLTSVKFEKIDYQWASLEVLGRCTNLRNVDFVSDDLNSRVNEEYTVDQPKQQSGVNGAAFTLRSLKLQNQAPSFSAAVVKMGGSSLKKLTLDKISTEIVQTILRSATRITHLYLDITSSQNLNFENHCSLIGGLKLTFLRLTSSNSSKEIDTLLTLLINKMPTTLRSLELEQEFSLPPLGAFLEKCDAPLKELTLFPNTAIDTEYLTTVMNYTKEKKSLKILNLNLSWESGLVNGRFTRKMTDELQQCIFTVHLDKLRNID
ncbi:2026_t:CDS:1 [Acaulospora morrowiae]|uniref:2026_t:CDS:1 n=1 Tax=Acaulospora morrowiae TaxID=94023 RepID=A0A9N8VRG8_9GLOM|nr:2026_t:CDS:1 [Acaulospora morrowiae]